MSEAYLRGAMAAQQDIDHDNWVDGDTAVCGERGAVDQEDWQKGYDSVMKPFMKKKQAA